jgi:hypothetical protein
MNKVKCVDCFWYEPGQDARSGFCLFDPPKPVPIPMQVAPSPIARISGQQQQQLGLAAHGVVPPTAADSRCHNWDDDFDRTA